MDTHELNFNRVDRPRMLESLVEALEDANAFSISVSFLRYSGVSLLMDPLRAFLKKGGRGRLLTSDYLALTQPEALEALLGISGLECRVHSSSRGFHPKFYTFEGRDKVWVGSSNISKGGLTDNLEANLLSQDSLIVRQALNNFDRLWEHRDVFVPSQAWLEAYTERYRRHLRPPIGPITPRLAPKPNDAQMEALARLATLRRQGENKAVVVAAPGVGKTFLAAFDAMQMEARTVLFVSHRLEHLTQAQTTFRRVFGDGVSTGLVGGGHKESDAQMVFCSIQSLRTDVGQKLLERRFDFMVVDEFHHASAKSYQNALKETSPRFLLGLTATPERQDGHDVLQLCDYNIAYEVRLVEAIERGWLLPFHYFGVADETVAWQAIPWRNGRFDPDALENALLIEARVDVIVNIAKERGFDGIRRATVGFCAGVRHANYMASAFNRRGLEAESLVGTDSLARRQKILARLADPDDALEWLFVADLLNEGVDVPAINSLLFLRPTQSPTIFLQQLGRGLRLTPGCEVLTAIDFVGHHRNAWLPLDAITASRKAPNASTRAGVTPPSGCEIVLDEQTQRLLDKVKRYTGTKKQRCLEAYRLLRGELESSPLPIDLWGRADMPEYTDFRSAFGSWLELRRQAGDAQKWERSLSEDHALMTLLSLCERDWQQQRVYAYALLFGLIQRPDAPEVGYQRFFARFPRWSAEYKPLGDTNAWNTLQKKLKSLLKGRCLDPEVFEVISTDELSTQVMGRLRLTLEKDFKIRHGGVLRAPDDLVLHQSYPRHEIINHFGRQYDPALHNTGVINLDNHTVIITKLDTSAAKADYQYSNQILSKNVFRWQSQNKQRQDNEAGRRIIDHDNRGVSLHLFVQRRSGVGAVCLGQVSFHTVEGNGPMTVTFKLREPLTEGAASELGVVL